MKPSTGFKIEITNKLQDLNTHKKGTNWKIHLKQLKLDHIRRTAHDFFELSGGYQMKVKPYDDRTATGLTRCICDFVTHLGGYANRISTTGTMRKIDVKLKWAKGNSHKGAADVRLLFRGHSIDVEEKIGKDKLSPAQHAEWSSETAGGLYYVARIFPEFLEWWKGQDFETGFESIMLSNLNTIQLNGSNKGSTNRTRIGN